LVGLEDVVHIESLVASAGRRRAGTGFSRSTGKFPIIDQQIEPTTRSVEHDLVPIADEPDGAAHRRLWGDVKGGCTRLGPAHAPVGDTHHVAHVGLAKHQRYRDETDLWHARRSHRPGVPQYDDGVGRGREVGVK
jgi:hypothetical protein